MKLVKEDLKRLFKRKYVSILKKIMLIDINFTFSVLKKIDLQKALNVEGLCS